MKQNLKLKFLNRAKQIITAVFCMAGMVFGTSPSRNPRVMGEFYIAMQSMRRAEQGQKMPALPAQGIQQPTKLSRPKWGLDGRRTRPGTAPTASTSRTAQQLARSVDMQTLEKISEQIEKIIGKDEYNTIEQIVLNYYKENKFKGLPIFVRKPNGKCLSYFKHKLKSSDHLDLHIKTIEVVNTIEITVVMDPETGGFILI